MPTLSKTINNLIKQHHMKEVKITIPDGYELIKNGNTYIVKECEIMCPKSWEEFCNHYPIKKTEAFINNGSTISETLAFFNLSRNNLDKNLCTSKEEAEAFLALMQLRQLRKAWIGDWEQPDGGTKTAAIFYSVDNQEIVADCGNFWISNVLSFPTIEMATEFLECFRNLCEQAKPLL